jgi:hypothetical protein
MFDIRVTIEFLRATLARWNSISPSIRISLLRDLSVFPSGT